MKYKIYNIIMYGTDKEKLKLFKTRQNYLSYELYVISGVFGKYTLSYSKEVREIQKELNQVIQSAINQKGYNYNFTIEIGNSFFPQKKYENIILPSGYYDGLKIKIGKAEGKNWWCVLFPPMCLINESTSWFFKTWLRTVLSLLFQQSLVAIILLIIFSFNFSSNNIISQLMCIGGIYALVRANSYIRSLIGGISTDVSNNFNIGSKFLKNI